MVGGLQPTLTNTRYLERAVATLRQTEHVPETLLAHLSPPGWEHVNLTGDYVWGAPDSVSEHRRIEATADSLPEPFARAPVRALSTCADPRPSRTWGCSRRTTKWSAGPPLGGGMITFESSVHHRSSDLEHLMRASRRPTHLLLRVHPPVQQPLHRALGGRRRDRFITASGSRIIDDHLGLSRHVCLKIAQDPRHLVGGRGNRRRRPRPRASPEFRQ